MLSVSFEEYHQVIGAAKYLPCVSLVMPFEPKMGQKSAIEDRLTSAMNKVKVRLQQNYPDEKAVPVFHKLNSLIKSLNYNTHKKSIAVFVSPLIAKVYYLNIPVRPKITIDEDFEIRDLVFAKKEIHKYLLLVLSSNKSNIFLGNSDYFIRIVSNTPHHASQIENNVPELPSNFFDISYKKELILNNFLRHTDNVISIILQSYPFPLFVLGTDWVICHFKKLTNNSDHILNYVHGNFEESTEMKMRKAIAPFVADWKKVKQQNLLCQLNIALKAKKMVTGIADICTTGLIKKSCLLIVEKNYTYPAQHVHAENFYASDYTTHKSPFYIKDAIDEVIEKIFENGGDIEFVDDGVLRNYKHIVLIQTFKIGD